MFKFEIIWRIHLKYSAMKVGNQNAIHRTLWRHLPEKSSIIIYIILFWSVWNWKKLRKINITSDMAEKRVTSTKTVSAQQCFFYAEARHHMTLTWQMYNKNTNKIKADQMKWISDECTISGVNGCDSHHGLLLMSLGLSRLTLSM